MATQKRRVIYLSDEEWSKAQDEARRRGMTISAYFRSLIGSGEAVGGMLLTVERFNTRPFRPVPKK